MNNENIKKYIQEHPKYLNGYYGELANKFNITYEKARHIARGLRKEVAYSTEQPEAKKEKTTSFSENVSTGEASFSFNTTVRVKTKEDLIALGMIDLNEFEIDRYEITTWEGYRKDNKSDFIWKDGVIVEGFSKDSGKIVTETLYRVNVKLKRRRLDTDLQKQKELILAEIKSQVPISNPLKEYRLLMDDINSYKPNVKYLLEISLFDFHWGKFSWSEETGEDFDLKIAEERFKSSVKKLLNRVNLDDVERILFPIGNDLINVDNKFNTTTAGTPQDTDSRFFKIIKVVKRVLIEVINELSLIAPVDVITIPGNHDETSSLFVAEILDAFYTNNPLVHIDCSPKLRKYYQYGTTTIMFSHGNEEKHHDLGLIFATEEPDKWATSTTRLAQIGHFHKSKKIEYVSVDEFQGFQVQILPSLSGTDSWHKKKGFMSRKQAKAFLFHKDEGLTGEFTISI